MLGYQYHLYHPQHDIRIHSLEEVEQQVDGLLKKVHNDGFDGLSEAEKQQLRQASQQYRERSPRPEETV